VWIKGHGGNAKKLPAGTKSEPLGTNQVKDPVNLDAGDEALKLVIKAKLQACRENGHDFGMADP
jgi:hypothetical protein